MLGRSYRDFRISSTSKPFLRSHIRARGSVADDLLAISLPKSEARRVCGDELFTFFVFPFRMRKLVKIRRSREY